MDEQINLLAMDIDSMVAWPSWRVRMFWRLTGLIRAGAQWAKRFLMYFMAAWEFETEQAAKGR